MPLAPQPGVDVHAGKAVTGGGEFALKRLTPHLSVIDHRKAELLLHSDDLPHRAGTAAAAGFPHAQPAHPPPPPQRLTPRQLPHQVRYRITHSDRILVCAERALQSTRPDSATCSAWVDRIGCDLAHLYQAAERAALTNEGVKSSPT